jgi:hypothetical protein
VVNEDDRQVIGNSFPDWSYGLNLEVVFKNFDFSLFFQGVSGRDGYLENPTPRYGGNVYTWETDKWTPDNLDARWEGFGTNNSINSKISTNYIADGSYLRLKTLQLGYTFPGQLISGIGMENLRVYAAGQNLWTVTSYFEGFDPEASSGAYQYYPNLTRFSLGLDLNF